MLASLAEVKKLRDMIYSRKSRLQAYGIRVLICHIKYNRSQCLIGRFLWKRNGMHFSVVYTKASLRTEEENLQPYWPWSNDTFSTSLNWKKILCHMSSRSIEHSQKKAVKNRLLCLVSESQNFQRRKWVFPANADLSVWKFVPNWSHVSEKYWKIIPKILGATRLLHNQFEF